MKFLLYLFLVSNINADVLDSIKSGISTGIVYTKEKSEIAPIKAELISIDMDLDRAYKVIGKRYVEFASKNTNIDIGVNTLLEKLKPLLEKKQNLEKEITNIKSKYKANDDFNAEIDKLELYN